MPGFLTGLSILFLSCPPLGWARFVTVGQDGAVVYSSDGNHWEAAGGSATSEWLDGVAWSGEQFVAVGVHGTIVYSSDGDRWEQDDTISVEGLLSVTWGGGRFVAVGRQGTILASRSDETVADADPAGVPAAGTDWELVQRGGGSAAPTRVTGAHLEAVAWGGERFVAVGDDGLIVHSTDGDRWQEASGSVHLEAGRQYEFPVLERLYGIAWGDGRYVAVGNLGTIVHGDDGDQWNKAGDFPERATYASIFDVTWDGERFVAVGVYVLHSSDGERWGATSYSTLEWGVLFDVVWSGTRYVAIGDIGAIVYSDDGDRWLGASGSAAARDLRGVAWNAERFVAVGVEGTIVHSRDGERWEFATGSLQCPEELLNDVVWNGDRFVAVGSLGTIVYSDDGDHWVRASVSAAAGDLQGVAWNGERFVAVGRHGTVLVSPPREHRIRPLR